MIGATRKKRERCSKEEKPTQKPLMTLLTCQIQVRTMSVRMMETLVMMLLELRLLCIGACTKKKSEIEI